MNKLFDQRKLGFYLSFGAGALAVLGTVAYIAVYMLTAGDSVDRVFNWMTVGFMLGGGVIALVTEAARLRFGPLVAVACYSLAFANHLVESAYPLADVLTGVPFFGGNFTLALIFAIVFGVATVCTVAAAFMEHNENELGGNHK